LTNKVAYITIAIARQNISFRQVSNLLNLILDVIYDERAL